MLNHWLYFPASRPFAEACATEATRHCITLAACIGDQCRLITDAYLMGGEL